MGNDPETPEASGIYQFGAFFLDPEERLLTLQGRPVRLPPGVFNTLLILVVNAGSLVRKSDLMDFVWQGASRLSGPQLRQGFPSALGPR